MPQARAGSSRAAGSNRTPGGGGGRPPVTYSLGHGVAALRPRCRRPAALAGAGCPGGARSGGASRGFGSPPAPGSIRPPAGPAPSRPRARANKGSTVPLRRTENWRRWRSCSTRMGPPCSSALGGVACAIARADTGDRGPQRTDSSAARAGEGGGAGNQL